LGILIAVTTERKRQHKKQADAVFFVSLMFFVGVSVFPPFGLPLHLAFRQVPAKFRMTASLEANSLFYSL
jgi:hypothetical protein